ncbi:MAG: hypothetical protein IPK27_08995 [Rhodanobacteraceae bacterium]|nr:hypothetical protein [Rhodanobacteraceae bacterium]
MRRWPWLGLVALAAMPALLRQPPTPPEGRADAGATSIRPAPQPGGASDYAVLHARELASALAAYEAQADEHERRRMRVEVDAACRAPVLLRLDGRDDPDPRRDPARRELERRCADLPVPSMFVPLAETNLPDEEAPDAQAGARALERLRLAGDGEDLAAAWLVAFQSGVLPQNEIFADHRRLLPAEAEALIRVVLDWRVCARQRACGADSLIALRVCALHGCAPGSDVQSAWHQALSPRDYESAMAIHIWLQQWQLHAAR